MSQIDNHTNYETLYIKDQIQRCEDLDEYKEEIYPLLRSQQEQWTKKINEIIAESGLNKSKFAEVTGFSRMAVNKWCNGAIPKNRETFLRIGMAAGYNREQMDQLLQRYGQYPALYAKSLEDCVCIFVLENDYGSEALTKYNYILDKIKDNIICDKEVETEDISTVMFDEKLSDVKDETALEQLISGNSSTFATAYHRFYAFVKMHIMANFGSPGESVYSLAEGQGWSSSLKQSVSAIRQNKWYPTRNKIISLGLHLSMDHEMINEMLELAHMEPLYAKNIFESVIIFILENASLNNVFDDEPDEHDPDELCRYAKDVLEELNLPEVEHFISELAEIDD